MPCSISFAIFISLSCFHVVEWTCNFGIHSSLGWNHGPSFWQCGKSAFSYVFKLYPGLFPISWIQLSLFFLQRSWFGFSSFFFYLNLQCELDIMFHLEKAHFMLEEMVMNGCIVETSKTNILQPIQLMEKSSWKLSVLGTKEFLQDSSCFASYSLLPVVQYAQNIFKMINFLH